MGELILCNRPIAATPIYLEEAALHIYSLEELSYYIAENSYLLSPDFISIDLCRWIGKELGFKDLEKQLEESIQSQAPLHLFVGQILAYCGYLTETEIRKVLTIIASYENKSEVECQKMRADRLQAHGRLIDAIYEYEHMIDDGVMHESPAGLEGDVWHNLGCAYAKLFFFSEACSCFEEAYRRNHRHQTLRSMLACMLCKRDEEGFAALVEKYGMPKELVSGIREEVRVLEAQEELQQFEDRLKKLQGMEASLQKTKQQETLDIWKEEYRRLCRI